MGDGFRQKDVFQNNSRHKPADGRMFALKLITLQRLDGSLGGTTQNSMITFHIVKAMILCYLYFSCFMLKQIKFFFFFERGKGKSSLGKRMKKQEEKPYFHVVFNLTLDS